MCLIKEIIYLFEKVLLTHLLIIEYFLIKTIDDKGIFELKVLTAKSLLNQTINEGYFDIFHILPLFSNSYPLSIYHSD